MTAPPAYPFFTELARILNAGQSRSVVLCGNVNDLFFVPDAAGQIAAGASPTASTSGRYVPLVNFLCEKCAVKGLILVVYELNGPVRFLSSADREKVRNAYAAWKLSLDPEQVILQA